MQFSNQSLNTQLFLQRIDGQDQINHGSNEIVVIDFFDGNIDRPFVVGRIHEAERSPTKFDVKGALPDTKKLSGIRSKEVSGDGFNQLRFDDTTGQISAQLHSSHGATQLNLGNLSHPKEQAQSDGRGEGFELRTDFAGAIRSKGLYISTFEQVQAKNTQLEVKEALDQVTESLESMKVLSEYAEKQKADITPKEFKAKAGQHIFVKGATESPTLPIFPNNICWECLARRAAQKGAFINKGEGI